MINNYTKIHIHTMLSNGVTNIDSVTKFESYIDRAKELNMKAMAFTEHGSVFQWVKKKEYCESCKYEKQNNFKGCNNCDKFEKCKGKNKIKYIHGAEFYITETLSEKVRDNYHCCLYAKNYEGVKEINKLLSHKVANNREDGHFYYTPRITFEELINTSDDIIITTACTGGILASDNDVLKGRLISFLSENKHRCFLEIQHHKATQQAEYNKYLYKLHLKYDIPLITGTDTHCLNESHVKGRSLLQKSKKILFDNESDWDLTFKTYDELVESYKIQNSLPMDIVLKAIENTNRLADMIEEFELDRSHKYPRLYDDSEKVFRDKINKGIKKREINKKENYDEYIQRIKYELDTYKHNGAIDFMLLEEDITSWCHENGIYQGYSRGSVSGSEIAYVLGITDMDSIKHNLNYERFMNKERVSLADIDVDYSPADRDRVKEYIYNKTGLYCADIITFNTIALKGSVRDVCKGLYSKNYDVVPKELMDSYNSECIAYGKPTDETAKKVNEIVDGEYLRISNYICSNIDSDEEKMRKEYPEVFEYVDIIIGTIVSVGTHPCGVMCSPYPLDECVGTFTTLTNKYPITQINMKEIDGLNFVKLDLLGLDNMQIINETCKLSNIKRLTPDNIDDTDEKVWESILDSNLGIFQWESDFAHSYYKELFSKNTIAKIKIKNQSFKYIDLFSIGNGAIRPAGESYREALSNGVYKDNGHKALNEFLAPTLGYLVYQEQIIEFLNKFCGFTMGQADIVRRGFSKKLGTEQFLPKIISGFKETMLKKYNMQEDESEKIIKDFIQVIEDASSYLFSLNHSQAYSYIGYACAWLRYYYPLEFLTVILNISKDNQEKTNKAIEFAKSKNIKIVAPKFRYSKSEYMIDSNTNSIYKGIESIKFMNSDVANELYALKDNTYINFYELLKDIKTNTSCNSRQLELLIRIGFFDEFGKIKKLLNMCDFFKLLFDKKSFKKDTLGSKISDNRVIELIEKNSVATDKTYTKFNSDECLRKIWEILIDEDINFKERISFENEVLGYINYKNEKLDKKIVMVTNLNTKYSPIANFYCLKNSNSVECKISKRVFNKQPLQDYDLIVVEEMKAKYAQKKVGEDEKGKPIFEADKTKKVWWIEKYSKINNIDEIIKNN